MSRSTRREKAEIQLRTLEEQFRANLVAALRDCAAGRWGLFGCYDAIAEVQSAPLREMLTTNVAAQLIELGAEIECERKRLGHSDPFRPLQRYLEYRKMWSPNALGEPKLAAQFLNELGEHDAEVR